MKLKIGDNHKEEFIITQEMVNRFAELSGDKNPLHIEKKFANFLTNIFLKILIKLYLKLIILEIIMMRD